MIAPPGLASRWIRHLESPRVAQSGRTTKGYGLGLALVARIAEVHGGTLTITPRDGGGLIITLSLLAAPRPERSA